MLVSDRVQLPTPPPPNHGSRLHTPPRGRGLPATGRPCRGLTDWPTALPRLRRLAHCARALYRGLHGRPVGMQPQGWGPQLQVSVSAGGTRSIWDPTAFAPSRPSRPHALNPRQGRMQLRAADLQLRPSRLQRLHGGSADGERVARRQWASPRERLPRSGRDPTEGCGRAGRGAPGGKAHVSDMPVTPPSFEPSSASAPCPAAHPGKLSLCFLSGRTAACVAGCLDRNPDLLCDLELIAQSGGYSSSYLGGLPPV